MSAGVFRDRRGRVVALGDELGAGGEGTVFAVRGRPRLCAKIYRPDRAAERADKLRAMVDRRPWWLGRDVAWPVELLFGGEGREAFAGFVMPALRGMTELHRLLVPDERMALAGWLTQRDLHRLAAALARLVAGIHRAGHCVGDLKPQNVLVAPLRGSVALVDTDSFQIRGRRAGHLHRCPVITPEYGAPELCGVDLARADRTPASDAFALAVLVYQLLMGGSHPFEGELAPGQAGSVERVPGRIRRGLSPLVPGLAAIRPPPGALPFATLHPALQEAFVRCFGAGHAAPEKRPAAAEWEAALLAASRALVPCARNAAHLHDGALQRCPWCERRERTGLDLFPRDQRWQRRALALVPDASAAPEQDRARWLALHVRGRLAGGPLTPAELAWLAKAGAGLGFGRDRVAATIAATLAAAGPEATLRSRLLRAWAGRAVLRRPLPTAPRALWISAAALGAAAGMVAVLVPSRLAASTPGAAERAPPGCAVLADRAAIGNTRGRGAFLRAAPSLASDRQPLPERTAVRLTGRTATADGLTWSEVEALGSTGWVASRYVVERR